MKRVIGTLLSVAAAGVLHAQLHIMPVHDAPTWKIVSGLPQAPGAAVGVSSLATNQIIGQLKPDEKFLAFGTDGKVVTLAFNGTIGYIPVEAAKDMYPSEQVSSEWKSYGRTLEEIADEEKSRETDIKGRSLAPQPKKAASGAAGGAGGAPGAAMDEGGGRRGGGGAGAGGGK